MGLSFMAAPIMAGLSQRRPVSAGRSRYSCVPRDSVKETDRKKECDLPGRKET